MRITQGTFSHLDELTDDEIRAQVRYALRQGWSLSVEHTDDPHPRNAYWQMWGLPMFDVRDPAAVLLEVNLCRSACPDGYVRLNAYDSSYGRQTTALQFIVQRPAHEPGFGLQREEGRDRTQRYTLRAYALDAPPGMRYAKRAP